MNTNIYNYQFDFEQQNGHFMVIKGQESSDLTSEHLATVEVNMLKANTIDKMLPIDIEEIDFNVRLYYNTTDKRILSHVLREDSLSINELYELLYQIISGIETSKEYMLNEQHYIIQDDFIFIGKNLKDVYLTYLPLIEVEQKANIKEELRELLFKLVGQVRELTGDGVQQLMSALSDDNFNVGNVKKLLNQLRKQTNTNNGQTFNVNSVPKEAISYAPSQAHEQQSEQPVVKNHITEQDLLREKLKSDDIPVSKRPPKKKTQRKIQRSEKGRESVEAKGENNVKDSIQTAGKDGKKPSPIVIGVIGIIPIVAVWKAYESFGTNVMLYIAIIITILSIVGAIGAFLFLKNKGTGKGLSNRQTEKLSKTPKAKKRKKPSSNEAKKDDNAQLPSKIDRETNKQIDFAHTNKAQQIPNSVIQQSNELNEEAYFKGLQNQTTLLSDEPGTVLLNEDIPPKGIAYLEVQRDHGPERIPIYQSTFTVGRNSSGIEYVENSVGISRLHFEIENNNEQFKVKDLGSKNGSKLNNEPMIAYKLYTLNDGDVIQAGKVEYLFKKG